VNVTDANNCLQTLNYTITQPLPLSVIHTQTNVSCFGGSDGIATSSVSGGTAPYSYNWMPGNIATQDASGLSAGTYTLTITDALNCSLASTVTITEPPLLVASTSITDETCDYLNNGTATASQTGGTPGYTYLWAHNGQTTNSVTNLASGTYSVTITDSKGCTSIATAVINEPPPIVITFTDQINVSCFGGSNASIGSIISGGTPNYTYSWSPGGSSNNALFNIAAGTYSLTITDNNSCVAGNTVTITQPATPVSVGVSSSTTSCFGGSDGSANATASGGTPGYVYNWFPGAIGSSTITNLASGTYTIQVLDFNGCVGTNTVFIIQPTPILTVVSTTPSTCGNPNGIGSVSVSGGVGPFTYQWLPAGGTNSITIGTPGIPAGIYTVVVTDANGCATEDDLLMNDLTGPSVTIYSVTNVSCYGFTDGSASANVTGGFGAVTYSWSPYGGTGLTATGLGAGTYYLTAIDANGCISSAVTDPTVTQPPPLTDVVMTSSVLCFGGSTGSATVTAGGGTPNYNYTWLPGLTTGDNISNLSAGVYSVQTIDNNNCSYTSTFVITEPVASVSAITSSTLTLCFGSSDGKASVSASGGTFPYIYNWLPGNIAGQTITNLPSGTYTAVVTDINNCPTTSTVFVNQPTQVTLSSTSINSDCGAANGQASVNASGGTGAYSYTWSPSGEIMQMRMDCLLIRILF
jgi:hypothetical protein